MRDNGISEAQGQDGLDWFAGLAREALGRLVSMREQGSVEVRQDHLDALVNLLGTDQAIDPVGILSAMRALHLDPEMVACGYAPEAARVLGKHWEQDELSFVDVTVRTERLHALVRQVDEMLAESADPKGPAALVLVAEAEQHTLGAFVLALQLRLAGFSATVRVAPPAGELTLLMGASHFDLALVSIGCTAGLDSGVGLVRMLRLMSRGETRIYVGGAVPLSDKELLAATGADRVLRDVTALLADYDGCGTGLALDRSGKRRQRISVGSSVKGDGVDK